MSTLGKIVYLSEAQASELFANGSITVDGSTITYSADDLYLTPENIEYVQKSGDTMSGTLATPRLNIVSNSIPVLWYMSDDTTDAGQVGLRLSDKRYFIGYRNNANKNIYFSLPPLSSDNTSESTWYDILTTKGSYTMTGGLNMTVARIYNASYPTLAFRTAENGSNIASIGVGTNDNTMAFIQKSPDTSHYENYYLPNPASGLTSDKYYNIVTTKGSYTMSGTLAAKTLQTYNRGDNYASLSFKNTTTGSDNAAMNCYLSNNRVFITEYSPGTTYVERFYLPAPDSSRTASADYNIITSKNISTPTLTSANSNVVINQNNLVRFGQMIALNFVLVVNATVAANTTIATIGGIDDSNGGPLAYLCAHKGGDGSFATLVKAKNAKTITNNTTPLSTGYWYVNACLVI